MSRFQTFPSCVTFHCLAYVTKNRKGYIYIEREEDRETGRNQKKRKREKPKVNEIRNQKHT